MAKADKGMGHGTKVGHEHVGPNDPDQAFDQDDLANEIKGRNKLQGEDQSRHRNERETVPDAKRKTEGVVESFERMDPKARSGKKDE